MHDTLAENTLPDSGMSDGSVQLSDEMQQVAKVSVREGIKLFQKDINKVAVENVKFPKWKQQRARRKTLSVSGVSLIDSDFDSGQAKPPYIHARGSILSKESVLSPELTPKTMNVQQKRVSYAKNEVTVFGSQNELLNLHSAQETLVNHSFKRSRQIHPSSYVAPEEPPRNVSDDHNGRGNSVSVNHPVKNNSDTESDEMENEEQVPVLPSVKNLSNKFQVLKTSESKPQQKSNKV